MRTRTEKVLADHASTYIDQEGEERCDCGKWLEPGCHEWPQHVAWMLKDAGLLSEDQ